MVKGNKCIFLIPLRVNTNYWDKWVFPFAAEIRFFTGRIRFQGFDAGSPCPVGIVVFDSSRQRYGSQRRFSVGDYSWNQVLL